MLLAPEDIDTLARILVEAHLANEDGRVALWSGIPAAVLAQVPEVDVPAEQLRIDLNFLNGRIADRPLATYLATAMPLVVQPGDQVALEAIVMRLPEMFERAQAQQPVATSLAARPVYLVCDREAQWEAATRLIGDPQPYVILLPGAEGEAHDYFGERLLKWPDRSYSDVRHMLVEWPGGRPPDDGADFRAALWRGLGGRDETYDDGALADRLRTSSDTGLLIVHPCVHLESGNRADAIETYCGEVLPELMKAAGSPRVKVVLPLAWTPSRFWRWLWELLRPDDPWADAPNYVRRLVTLGPHVRNLPALEPIDRTAVERLFEQVDIEKSDRADLVTFVTRVRTSLELFSRLKRLLKDRATGARA